MKITAIGIYKNQDKFVNNTTDISINTPFYLM